jgi:hypothetical protein
MNTQDKNAKNMEAAEAAIDKLAAQVQTRHLARNVSLPWTR